MSKAIAVRLDNITKRFGNVIAVNNLSHDFEKGLIHCIVGPSGSGKTTLLRIIIGSEKPDNGRLIVDGEDMTNVPPWKRNIAMAYFPFYLFPNMNVFENISFGLKVRGVKKEEIEKRVKETMELLLIRGLEKRRITELSGGQQSRVGLARALILKPKLLLLDEPVGNVDYMLQRKMVQDLKEMHEKTGLTFLYVTHNIEQAMLLANSVALMNRGNFEQVGEPTQIYTKPQTFFAARFIGSINAIFGRILSGDGKKIDVKTDLGTLTIPHSDDLEKIEEVILSIRPEKISLLEKAKKSIFNCEGIVRSRKITGSVIRYQIELKNENVFEVHEFIGGAIVPDIGSKVLVGWNPEDMFAYDKRGIGRIEDIYEQIR